MISPIRSRTRLKRPPSAWTSATRSAEEAVMGAVEFKQSDPFSNDATGSSLIQNAGSGNSSAARPVAGDNRSPATGRAAEELPEPAFCIRLEPVASFEKGSDCLNSTAPITASSADLVAEVQALGGRLSLVRERIGEIIFGQREVVEQALITLLCGGHALLIGVPGLAKTRLVETLGTILGLEDKRIQCTPDLMPADILGSEVLEESETGRRSFRFIPGPVFCQLLMADEINRASPRTQSALLQAMQEGR